jgi:hypothetical protein
VGKKAREKREGKRSAWCQNGTEVKKGDQEVKKGLLNLSFLFQSLLYDLV